jgi:ribosomal 50S subunit-recycling heat shock protein
LRHRGCAQREPVAATRALAAEAVVGRVHVNGERVKPAMLVHPNDVLEITRGTKRRTVRVLEVAEPPVA